MPAQLRRIWMVWLSEVMRDIRPETEDWSERSQVYISHLRSSASMASFVFVLDVSL